MKKILLLILGLFFFGLTLTSAQVCLQKSDGKGIYVDRAVTQTEIITLFGQPERTDSHEDEAAGGYMQTYSYPNLQIAVVDGVFYDFAFSRSDLQVVVYQKYCLKAGDQYKAFLDAVPASDVMCRTYDDEVQLFFKIEGTEVISDSSLIVAFDKTGKVIHIRWYSPV